MRVFWIRLPRSAKNGLWLMAMRCARLIGYVDQILAAGDSPTGEKAERSFNNRPTYEALLKTE